MKLKTSKRGYGRPVKASRTTPGALVYSPQRDAITATLRVKGFLCQEQARNSPRWQPPAKHEYRGNGGSVIVWWEVPGTVGEYIREVWCRRVPTSVVADLFPPKTKIQLI